jgi:hypothetical protein
MQDAVKAIFYNSKISIISKQPFSQKAPNDTKKLGNVKCYPIDLVNQIDEAGNVFIDQDTNKPIDIKAVTNPEGSYNIDLSAIENERINQKKNENYVKYIIVFTVVMIFLIGLIIAVFVWASGSKNNALTSISTEVSDSSSSGESASSSSGASAIDVVSTIATILAASSTRGRPRVNSVPENIRASANVSASASAPTPP